MSVLPLYVAIFFVYAAESWIFTLVAPYVPAIFALYFFQSYLIDCLSELSHPSVQVWVALVSFLIDHIEIPR